MKPTFKNAVIAISTIALLSSASVNTYAQLTTFPQDTYVTITKKGMNTAAKNYTIYTSTSPMSGYTTGPSMNLSHDLNGIGLNSIDNFVYGAAYVGNDNTVNNNFGVSLYRVGANGQFDDLGLLPTTGQNSVELISFSAGTMTNEGSYYFTSIGVKPSGVSKLLNSQLFGTPLNLDASDIRLYVCWIDDVATLPASPGTNINRSTGFYEVDFNNASMTMAINNFLAEVNAEYPNVYNADGGIQDIAISPIDGKIYGYITYPDGTDVVGRPIVLSELNANGLVPAEPVGSTINTEPGQEIAGIAFNETGNLYGLFTTGEWATIDLTTGGITLSPATIPTTNGNLRGDMATPYTIKPLPVKMTNFTAIATTSSVKLSWSTASEINNYGFYVERSNDGTKWETLELVRTKATDGNSNFKINYDFEDAAPAKINYYRLKQTNIDNRFEYSVIRQVNFNANNTIQVYPNPASNFITLNGLNGTENIAIYNMNGEKVMQENATSNIVTLTLSNLSKGIYTIQIADKKGTSKWSKIVVQ